MRIGGAGYYQDMGYTGSLRSGEMSAPKVSEQKTELQNVNLTEEKNDGLSQSSTAAVPETELKKVDKIANLEEVSLSFNKEDDFGYIGRDSDIFKLDVEKAISDMKRDSVLEEYQYFVGSSQTLTEQQSADGVVIPKMYFE